AGVKHDAGDPVNLEPLRDDTRRVRLAVVKPQQAFLDIGRRALADDRSEEHTSELQSRGHLVCRLLLEKKKNTDNNPRRYKIDVIYIQIALKQMLRDFIDIRVNRAKKSDMVNITSSVNSRERSSINIII